MQDSRDEELPGNSSQELVGQPSTHLRSTGASVNHGIEERARSRHGSDHSNHSKHDDVYHYRREQGKTKA